MPDAPTSLYFDELRRQLTDAGVTQREISRTIDELRDHLEDIQLQEHGVGTDDAIARLGSHQTIAEKLLAHRELCRWPYRYPRIARIYMPLAYMILLPAVPLFTGIAHASHVARWGVSLLLGAAITASMLLFMQLSITLS